jgi:hypothetical protein
MAIEPNAEIIPPQRRRSPATEQAPLSDSAALLMAIEKAALGARCPRCLCVPARR